jgi:drug/metabolite transporter (DMT)-like permease
LGAGKCVLIGNTWTIFAALMAVGVLGEKLTAAKLTGIAVALVGLGLLMGVGPGKFGQEWRWELIQLGGAVMAAMVVVVIRQLTKTETSATIFMSQCIYGVLLAVPFALLHQTALNGTVISLLLLAGLLAAAGQLAMTEGFRHLTVAAGGAFQIILPLAISVGGVLLFDEHFGPWQILGGVLILAGCFQTIARGQNGR